MRHPLCSSGRKLFLIRKLYVLSETTPPVGRFHIKGRHDIIVYPIPRVFKHNIFFLPTLRSPSSHSEHRQAVLQFGHEGRSASSTRILELCLLCALIIFSVIVTLSWLTIPFFVQSSSFIQPLFKIFLVLQKECHCARRLAKHIKLSV